MKSNFRWHHVEEPDHEYPKHREALIVRCREDDNIRVNDDFYIISKFNLAYFDNEDNAFYSIEGGNMFALTNIAAWCYIKDVYDQLNNTGWGFDPDREANDDNNT